MTTRAIGYVRVSTDEQAAHGVSLAAQEAKLRAYAELYEIELIRVEVDAGASAKSLNRPALQRALASLKRREADAILVAKLDRLTRSVRDLADLLDDYFRDDRRALLSVAEQIDTRSASGRLVLNVMTSVAEWEREAIGERTATALHHLAGQGRHLGAHAPYGYRSVAGEPVAEGPRAGFVPRFLVEDADEQAVIAEARALRASGLGLAATGRTLAERGRVSRTGRPFTAEQVSRMLVGTGRAVAPALAA